jgi:ArsR family transcriptional regulator
MGTRDAKGGAVLQDEQDRTPERLADLFKILGDPTRVRILMALERRALCVQDIAAELNMTPSAISHQLRLLKQARLVRSRREGRNIEYAMDDDHVAILFRQGMHHVTEIGH